MMQLNVYEARIAANGHLLGEVIASNKEAAESKANFRWYRNSPLKEKINIKLIGDYKKESDL